MEVGCFESVFLTVFFGYCAIIAVSQAYAYMKEGVIRKNSAKSIAKEATGT